MSKKLNIRYHPEFSYRLFIFVCLSYVVCAPNLIISIAVFWICHFISQGIHAQWIPFWIHTLMHCGIICYPMRRRHIGVSICFFTLVFISFINTPEKKYEEIYFCSCFFVLLPIPALATFVAKHIFHWSCHGFPFFECLSPGCNICNTVLQFCRILAQLHLYVGCNLCSMVPQFCENTSPLAYVCRDATYVPWNCNFVYSSPICMPM